MKENIEKSRTGVIIKGALSNQILNLYLKKLQEFDASGY